MTLSVTICHYDECIYCYAECHHAVCHYAECRYAECRVTAPSVFVIVNICDFHPSMIFVFKCTVSLV
jgi:hypothetical protein